MPLWFFCTDTTIIEVKSVNLLKNDFNFFRDEEMIKNGAAKKRNKLRFGFSQYGLKITRLLSGGEIFSIVIKYTSISITLRFLFCQFFHKLFLL